jgi:hypothetical protein
MIPTDTPLQHEFPDFPIAPMPELGPLVCEAWHNDTCPVWRHRTDTRIFELWVDHEDPDMRELPRSERYVFYVHATDDGDSYGTQLFAVGAEQLDGLPDLPALIAEWSTAP